jgi:hypothetical protein
MVTRKLSKSLRVPARFEDIMSIPTPTEPGPRDSLYPTDKYYVPGTTCYPPGIRERFGHGFGATTLQAFREPVPKILAPLTVREDAKQIDQLSLVPGYTGFRPGTFPEIQRRVDTLTGGGSGALFGFTGYTSGGQSRGQTAVEGDAGGENTEPGNN